MKWRDKGSWSISQAKQFSFEKDKRNLLMDIEKAHKAWLNAQNKFHNALEWDEIDYAVFAMEAAEKKYIMLLRKAKQEKITKNQELELNGMDRKER